MVFPAPDLVVAATIEPLNQLQVLLECKRGIDARFMKGREKDAKPHAMTHL
jgi:hypothetical protein